MNLAIPSLTLFFAFTIILAVFEPCAATAKTPYADAQLHTLKSTAEVSAKSSSDKIPPLPSAVRDAPVSLNIGGLAFRLQAFIYRNFMPLAISQDEAGLAAQATRSAMIATITLSDDQGLPVPTTLHAETIWILQGESVWETNTIEESRSDTRCDFVVRNGPKWQPGSSVDIIVRLTDGNGGSFFLAIRQQAIVAAS